MKPTHITMADHSNARSIVAKQFGIPAPDAATSSTSKDFDPEARAAFANVAKQLGLDVDELQAHAAVVGRRR